MMKRIVFLIGLLIIVGISSTAYAQYFGFQNLSGIMPNITIVSEPASLLIMGIVMLALGALVRGRQSD